MKLSETNVVETNVALMNINERLTNECTVKGGKLQSLNESLVQTQQKFAKCKEALTRTE